MLNGAMDTPSSVCVPNGPPLEFYHRDVIDGMRVILGIFLFAL